MGSVWRHISLYTSAVYSVSTILAFSCFSFLIWTISFLMSQSFLKGGHNLEYPWEEKNLISCKQKLTFAIMLYDGLKPIAVKELKSSWSSESWATDTHSDGFCKGSNWAVKMCRLSILFHHEWGQVFLSATRAIHKTSKEFLAINSNFHLKIK